MGLMEDIMGLTIDPEVAAQYDLQKEGSVMAKEKYKPGPLGIPGDVIRELLDKVNPINWMGSFGGALAHVPGTFRNIALRRQSGALDPGMFAAAIQAQPNYPRYKQLVEGIVRRAFGPEFKAWRGLQEIDPLVEDVVLKGSLPKATAVSLDSAIADNFARYAAGKFGGGSPSHLVEFQATPESVLGLTARRGAAYREKELLLDPRKVNDIRLRSKIPVDRSTMYSYAPEQAPDSITQSLISDILEALRAEK